MAPRPRSGVVLAPAPPPPSLEGVPTRTSPKARKRSGLLALTQLGPRGYLYLLVIVELAAIAGLRHMFRDHHGG